MRLVVEVLSVFGDESYDEKEQRVFAVSGIAGTQEEWDTLEPVWISRTGGKAFHAADCEAGRGDYNGISHKENLNLYADLIKMLVRTNMIGFAAVVDLKVYNELFPDVVDNQPYHICFHAVVEHFAEIAYFPQHRQKVKFTFDRNSRTLSSSSYLYEYLATTSDWKYAECLDEISFSTRNNIGIQAADLIAREAMKHYDNVVVGPTKRPIRKSMQALLSTGRYTFTPYSRKYFSYLKENDEYVQKKAEFTKDDYVQWILKNKLADNVGNRSKFLLHKPNRATDRKVKS
jgi:hypothetical protein